ncbi:hypothetical protein PNEG_01613 [Pneumocystis murina B123]|uniref:COP9 signalosome complex subunit 5 n=1 Tax=Pneumocystis murina (strain B123) TaxID=1069680 RepID=M7NTF0_PNEMU|nr:hypothetical protein PNEG_01613 [Pneumocystis murina B123]EMR10361.1 hypothetical protein PNEG_01613 [Pneumocystis murina B123]
MPLDPLPLNDCIYIYDEKYQKKQLNKKTWKEDPCYFKSVHISLVALMKMMIHCWSGNSIEVMGLMQGKIYEDKMIVMDAFCLPVEGTETRVNAQAEAYEYMVTYQDIIKQVNRPENIIGWYHSHPGYGSWLSGIDVETQLQNQKYQDPFLAIVIDPIRTVLTRKIDLGAFRTYPINYKPDILQQNYHEVIPSDKIEDFDVHSHKYYALKVNYFKSSLDSHILWLLLSKYWFKTLTLSSSFMNKEYLPSKLLNLSERINSIQQLLEKDESDNFSSTSHFCTQQSYVHEKKKDDVLYKIINDINDLANKEIHRISTQILKNKLFNMF